MGSSYTFKEQQAPKKTSQPVGTLNTSNLSVKELLNPQSVQHDDEVSVDVKEREPLDLDALNMHWRRYAHKLKAEKTSTYSLMTKKNPKIINDNTFSFELDNVVTKELFAPELNALMNYLRVELKNGALNIKLTIAESEQSSSNPYDPKEKFKILAEKNPNLSTLQRMFNLDLDY